MVVIKQIGSVVSPAIILIATGLGLCYLQHDRVIAGASHPSLEPYTEEPGLPRVLIIGDSISIGYTLSVRRKLNGMANVVRPPENCRSTKDGMRKLDQWLGNGAWQVIHFNWGLHDLRYTNSKGDDHADPTQEGSFKLVSPAQYRINLLNLVSRLQATGAALVFATTTPVPDGAKGRNAGEEQLYNSIALEIMHQANIAVNDLHYAVAESNQRLQLDRDVHFNETGYEFLGHLVGNRIEQLLFKSQSHTLTKKHKSDQP